MRESILSVTAEGLYCEAGGFHIDPWRPVERAVITHAHADHARRNCGRYLAAGEGLQVLRTRLGNHARIQALAYGESLRLDGVRVSLHPAGHMLGSAQVRVEHRGRVWVCSGDYKVQGDPTCTPFEPVRCHTFITESTFGLPVYRWPKPSDVLRDIRAWWVANREAGRASLLLAYAAGKAQRLIMGLDPSVGPILTHGAVEEINRRYRSSGVPLPNTLPLELAPKNMDLTRALIVVPPTARGESRLKRLPDYSTGFASGWMRLRGARRRRAVDRGFVLSDHADWPALMNVVEATGAEQVLVSHGYARAVARALREKGLDARELVTPLASEDGNEE